MAENKDALVPTGKVIPIAAVTVRRFRKAAGID